MFCTPTWTIGQSISTAQNDLLKAFSNVASLTVTLAGNTSAELVH